MHHDKACKISAARRIHTLTSPPATHPRRAIDAAVFTAELTGWCVREPTQARAELALRALRVVRDPDLYAALERAVLLGGRHAELAAIGDEVRAHVDPLIRALTLSTWVFVSVVGSEHEALVTVLRAGGDSDGAGAIVAGWLRMLHSPGACMSATRAA